MGNGRHGHLQSGGTVARLRLAPPMVARPMVARASRPQWDSVKRSDAALPSRAPTASRHRSSISVITIRQSVALHVCRYAFQHRATP